jgi:hypothetical protein
VSSILQQTELFLESFERNDSYGLSWQVIALLLRVCGSQICFSGICAMPSPNPPPYLSSAGRSGFPQLCYLSGPKLSTRAPPGHKAGDGGVHGAANTLCTEVYTQIGVYRETSYILYLLIQLTHGVINHHAHHVVRTINEIRSMIISLSGQSSATTAISLAS